MIELIYDKNQIKINSEQAIQFDFKFLILVDIKQDCENEEER